MGRDKKRGKQKRTQPVVDPRLRTRSRIEAQSRRPQGQLGQSMKTPLPPPPPPPRRTKNVRVERPKQLQN